MSTIVQLIQGSTEWHEHRRRFRNASETAAVLGVSPWQTPYQLWQIRTGRLETTVTAAMRHGSSTEPSARAAYEALTGYVMQPLVVVDGEYSASLDGMTFDGDLILEIKCPVKGRESSLWEAVKAGNVPEHYYWQVQHQLMVSGAKLAHLYVFDGTEGLLVEIRPESDKWPAIRKAWDAFMYCIALDRPPALTERDTVLRTDAEWQHAAEAYVTLKRAADEAAAKLKTAKEQLVALAQHTNEAGGGVNVVRYWKTGAVEYQRVPQLTGVDLEQYRSAPRLETRITVQR